jgi:hypothetical protein
MAANEAIGLGYGGISKVRLACGLSRKAIAKGIHEIQNGIQPPEGKLRRAGAGRKRITEEDPSMVRALDQLIEPETIGDPESSLALALQEYPQSVGRIGASRTPDQSCQVAQLLHDQNYSLQSNRKTEEVKTPDRDAQFQHINKQVKAALKAGLPVISVDTKRRNCLETTTTRAGNGGDQATGQGQGARLSGSNGAPSFPVWDLRSDTQCKGFVKRGHRSRHRGVRGGLHTWLVEF